MNYPAGVLLLTLLGAAGGAPARAAPQGLDVLLDGYTAVLIATEPVLPTEQSFIDAPQADRHGNRYQIEGGAPGRAILRASTSGVVRFARVSGPGDPYVVGLWFEARRHMIVVVERFALPLEPDAGGLGPVPLAVALRGASLTRERAYYRIKGFPARRAAAKPTPSPLALAVADRLPAGLASWVLRGNPAGSVATVLACVAVAMAALVRQLQRDVIALRRRR